MPGHPTAPGRTPVHATAAVLLAVVLLVVSGLTAGSSGERASGFPTTRVSAATSDDASGPWSGDRSAAPAPPTGEAADGGAAADDEPDPSLPRDTALPAGQAVSASLPLRGSPLVLAGSLLPVPD